MCSASTCACSGRVVKAGQHSAVTRSTSSCMWGERGGEGGGAGGSFREEKRVEGKSGRVEKLLKSSTG